MEKLLEKAEATLEDAKTAYNQDMLISTVQNRIYYSLYYAVQAALLSQDTEVSTHEGTKIKIWRRTNPERQTRQEMGTFLLTTTKLQRRSRLPNRCRHRKKRSRKIP